jgi:flagellar biosynthesis chaperone FliJ
MSAAPTIDVAINKLIELLALEKSRLLSGAYTGFEEITDQKQYYMSILSESILNGTAQKSAKSYQAAIERIKALATENEALLKAAKSGVNAAQTRIKNIMTRESFVGAYTENGQKLRTHDCGVTRCKTA